MNITHTPKDGAICAFQIADDAQLPNGMTQRCDTTAALADEYVDHLIMTDGMAAFCSVLATALASAITTVNRLKRTAVMQSQVQSVIINAPTAEGEVTL